MDEDLPLEAFLAHPLLGEGFHVGALLDVEAAEGTLPPTIGGYRIESVLGHGTFALVYRAVNTRIDAPPVAIKLLRGGAATRSVVARFERERALLAHFSHPGIARLHELGVTEDGRPWFAMDLVDGPTITDFSRLHELDLRDRVRLLRAACMAVQHAHAKGVIHRDLKPANLLVTGDRTSHQPTVIDFGIAKALTTPEDDGLLRTRVGQLVGTPSYMSPEQLEGRVGDVDIRSDVYALGVLLYELLGERRPLDLEGLDPHLAAIRARNGDYPPISRLCRGARGDLATIVERAMAPAQSQRYDSAAELAAELDRWLRREPIAARPHRVSDVLIKAARRRPLAAGLVFGAIGILVMALVLVVVLERASRRQIQLLFEAATSDVSVATDLTIVSGTLDERRTLLAAALAQSRLVLDARPRELQVLRLHRTVLWRLSEVDDEVGAVDSAHALRTELLTTARAMVAHPEAMSDDGHALIAALVLLGDTERQRGASQSAERCYLEAMSLAEASGPIARDPYHRLTGAHAMQRMAELRRQDGRGDEARHLFDSALVIHDDLLRAFPDRAAFLGQRSQARAHLVEIARRQGDLELALVLARESLADAQVAFRQRPSHRMLRNELAAAYLEISRVHLASGELERAGSSIRAAHDLAETLSRDDPGSIPGASREHPGSIPGASREHPGSIPALARLEESHALLAALAEQRGDFAAALASRSESLVLSERLCHARPRDPRMGDRLAAARLAAAAVPRQDTSQSR